MFIGFCKVRSSSHHFIMYILPEGLNHIIDGIYEFW